MNFKKWSRANGIDINKDPIRHFLVENLPTKPAEYVDYDSTNPLALPFECSAIEYQDSNGEERVLLAYEIEPLDYVFTQIAPNYFIQCEKDKMIIKRVKDGNNQGFFVTEENWQEYPYYKAGRESLFSYWLSIKRKVEQFIETLRSNHSYKITSQTKKRTKGTRQKKATSEYIVVTDTPRSKSRPNITTNSPIEWQHAWEVRAHWRKLADPTALGKDRSGNYIVPGYTFVREHEKGTGEIVTKTRIVK